MKSSIIFRIMASIGGGLFGYNIRGTINGWTNNTILLSLGVILFALALMGVILKEFKEDE